MLNNVLGQNGRNVRWPQWALIIDHSHIMLDKTTRQTDGRTDTWPLLYALHFQLRTRRAWQVSNDGRSLRVSQPVFWPVPDIILVALLNSNRLWFLRQFGQVVTSAWFAQTRNGPGLRSGARCQHLHFHRHFRRCFKTLERKKNKDVKNVKKCKNVARIKEKQKTFLHQWTLQQHHSEATE